MESNEIKVEQMIQRPIDEVWDALLDLRFWDRWFTIHAGWVGDPPKQLVVGQQIRQIMSMRGLPGRVEHRWTVLDLQPPKVMELTGVGLAGSTGHLRFELSAAGDDTALAADLELSGPMIPRLIRATLTNRARLELVQSLHNLSATTDRGQRLP